MLVQKITNTPVLNQFAKTIVANLEKIQCLHQKLLIAYLSGKAKNH